MSIDRRSILKALALTPAAMMLPRIVLAATKDAAPANALAETEPLANVMKYKADASKSGAERTDKKALCNNCAKFNICASGDSSCKPAAKGAAYSPCEIFSGKQVAAAGWCMSWTKKA